MRKTILLLICLMAISLCACGNTTSAQPVDLTKMGEVYGVGLTDDGYYVGLDTQTQQNIYPTTILEKDLLASIEKMLEADAGRVMTFDTYLELYANDLLSAMELDRKDIVENTDAVLVSLQFTSANGEDMPEYRQQNQRYVVSEDADAIVSSFLGHKVGDEYTVSYTFPETDEYHPSETVSVLVKIEDIYFSDALHSGVVEKHLEEINEILIDVKDVDTFKQAIYPYMLGYHLQDYLEEQIMLSDIHVDSAWTDVEMQRLQYRLDALDMTMDQYKKELSLSEDDIRTSCEDIARVNIVTMTYFAQNCSPITEEDLIYAYGADNLEYYTQLQGRPYLKLRLMRQTALELLAQNTVVLDENGAPIDLSVFFGTENEATTNDIEQNVTNPIE